MSKLLPVIVAICISQLGCSNTQPSRTTKVFVIEPQLVDCIGVAPMKCMVVNGDYFYDTIEGFTYKEGFHYTLEVEETHASVDEYRLDSSSTSYRLLKQIRKVAKPF